MTSSSYCAREILTSDGTAGGLAVPAAGTYYFQAQKAPGHPDMGFQIQVQGASANFSATVSFELRAFSVPGVEAFSSAQARNAAWCPFQISGTTYTQTLTPASGSITSTGKLTFTAVGAASVGNEIQVSLVTGGTAGAEIVTVSSNDQTGVTTITVKIQPGTSTAAQVKAALDANPAAVALISTTVTTAGVMTALSTQLVGGATFIDLSTAAMETRIKVVVTVGSASKVRAFYCAKS